MSLSSCSNYHKDMSYYVGKATSEKELLNLSESIKGAREELKALEEAVFHRYQEVQRIVWYNKVIIKREQNRYSKDKRVTVKVIAYRVATLDGIQINQEYIYGSDKSFSWAERKNAEILAEALSKKYNNCPIENMMKGGKKT